MLFDLRSRGRRRTVRVVYALLALVMVIGLVGLGVGTGSSGGILNAGENSSSGGTGNAVENQQLKRALKAVKQHPSANNWANLLAARWSDAGSGSNYNSTTSTYTASGKKQLQLAAQAWQQYQKLANQKSDPNFLQNAFLGAEIYQSLKQYSAESAVWNLAAQVTPGKQGEKPLLCLAYSSYAAKEKPKGDLAAAQAVKLLPKIDQLTVKAELKSASTSTTTAVAGLTNSC
jgi:hypothetical protein